MTSPSLLDRARNHDSVAWSRIVNLYSPLVFHWCRQSGFDSHDAADLMQEVFHAVSRSLVQFDRVKAGAFRAWLWTITRNKIRDLARKSIPVAEGGSHALTRMREIPDAEPLPDDNSLSGERKASLLIRALELVRNDFQPVTWKAFEAVIIQQRPAAEVAKSLNISLGAVYQARARVLRRLRDELGEFDDLVDFSLM
ncbi:MAG: sigma-70 family RNA polymerase sigma factor [Gemmataceae bacterium]